ncbi:hypothetical protein J6590_095081 [Homalodisca vitripennis]|nr:hypothetical protein J6590_095081 [Homalodisca vitripennis]
MTQLRQAQLRQNQQRQTPSYDSSSQEWTVVSVQSADDSVETGTAETKPVTIDTSVRLLFPRFLLSASQSSQLMTQLRQAQLRQNQRRQTPPYDSSSQGSCPQRLKSD